MITQIIIALISIWIILAIIIPFLVMPNLYIRKLRKQHSKYIEQTAKKLKAKSKEQTLKNIFKFVTKNYTGGNERYKLALYHRLFKRNTTKNLKHKNQFLACHQQNTLISTLLRETKQFKKRNIKKRFYITKRITAHQYLIVKVDDKKFEVDPFYKILKERLNR